jgi:hypothetical protein
MLIFLDPDGSSADTLQFQQGFKKLALKTVRIEFLGKGPEYIDVRTHG